MTGRFEFIATPIDGLKLMQRQAFEDSRGFLSRFYCAAELAEAGFGKPVAQINHTLTRDKGTVRGMHFQIPPYAETKVVSCLRGEVFDVAVDLRRESVTFLRWHAEILTPANRRSLVIPEGFAHGFQTLTDDCELMYLHTEAYHPEAEDALNALDVRLGIDWPLPPHGMSERDRNHAAITPDYLGVVL